MTDPTAQGGVDPRRHIPRTDALLAEPGVRAAIGRVGPHLVKSAVVAAQQRARDGQITPQAVLDEVLSSLPPTASSLRPVINATGVVLHTNLGRAPLSAAAVEALVGAAGYTDVEYDVHTGARARRGQEALAALRDAVPAAEDVLVVNNGAAALALATTALSAGRDVVVSRGEMVEIGDGFRLHELIASTGARVHEVGTTNRTKLDDYSDAVGEQTGCLLKVHPSNFRVDGFTSAVEVSELATLAGRGGGPPLVVDIGSGLLAPDPVLPGEPDAATVLTEGADLVTCSGDKLLGGPQAGLVLGRRDLVERLRRHPLARALRVDKLTLAALEATLRGPATPTQRQLHAGPDALWARCRRLQELLASGDGAVAVVPSAGAVGGGGAPGLRLDGWALALPESCAEPLRRGDPTVVARVEHGRTLVDLRCVTPEQEESLVRALRQVLSGLTSATEEPGGNPPTDQIFATSPSPGRPTRHEDRER
ncbi:MAG TPA: L-seryl-tRNA(Sec) selenium transferase [Segeticoccus sp.]|nr:L-seryl-tRNA(Sec) selenium transferase [Segeticoccus sp.]